MRVRTLAINENISPRLYVGGAIPSPDRDGIVRVVEDDCIRLWAELVHPDPERYAVRKLPSGHWAQVNEENWMGWHESANHPDRPDEVVPAIQRVTGWKDDDAMLFLFNRNSAHKTNWGIFLRNWRNFLRMNDEPLLIRPGTDIYLCFGSPGSIGWGYRPIHALEADLEWVSADCESSVGRKSVP